MATPPDSKRFKFDWAQTVVACRLGSTAKAVALGLFRHANADGRSARPGIRRLAHELELGESTVRRALDYLREVGLIRRVVHGSVAMKRKWADEYQLAIPDDLHERVSVQEEPATEAGRGSRGGRSRSKHANHIRWHARRGVISPGCDYCTETCGDAAETPSGQNRTSDHRSLGIRPPLAEDPATAPLGSTHQGCTTRDINHHSESDDSGSTRKRARPLARNPFRYQSFVASERQQRVQPGEVLTDEDEAELNADINYDYVISAVGALDEFEESTVDGMLQGGAHPKMVVNKVLRDRVEVA